MNSKHFSLIIFSVLSLMVSISHGQKMPQVPSFSKNSDMGFASLSRPDGEIFEANRDHIFAVVNEHVVKLLSLLLELPNYFDIDICEILEPQGLGLNSTLRKRSFGAQKQKRGFFSFLKDIVDTSLLAIGAVATVVTFFQPEFAPVAAAAFAIHDYLNKGVCQLPWVSCPDV